MKKLSLKTIDDFAISATIFEPENPNGKLLLINSATGVKQQLYFSFANYFAEKGYLVMTYDYSGIGDSKPKKMNGFNASMRTWGTSDFKVVTNFIKTNYSHHQKFCLGHSVGALILGMNEDSKIFSKFIFLATQNAYIGNLSFKVGFTALLGFGIALPISSSLMGYFPANWFGLGESLPKNVALDWKTLILNKKSTNRLLEKIENNFSKDLNQETFIVYAEDDTWVTQKGMENLMSQTYPSLKKTYREIKISESEKKEIGHVNFFRTYNKKLWQIILTELEFAKH